jgi:hypothetical protein
MGKTHTESGYMIFIPEGKPTISGVWARRDAAWNGCKQFGTEQKRLKELGYTCRKVRVTVEEIGNETD